jgi:hypothetical protein
MKPAVIAVSVALFGIGLCALGVMVVLQRRLGGAYVRTEDRVER